MKTLPHKTLRAQIRESVMTSLTSLAGNDVSAVVQLTPIMDKLTRVEDEISDEAEVCNGSHQISRYLTISTFLFLPLVSVCLSVCPSPSLSLSHSFSLSPSRIYTPFLFFSKCFFFFFLTICFLFCLFHLRVLSKPSESHVNMWWIASSPSP